VIAGVAIVLGAAVVAAAGARYLELRAMPEPYDFSASKGCLSRAARVQAHQPNDVWIFPTLVVRFDGEATADEWALSFAPSVEDAKAAERPDSERLLRRRNVLVSDRVADAPWDGRVLRCLRERPRAQDDH
jgi:hypothetical protein